MVTEDSDDRFGMPDAAFETALESHGNNNPFIRMGMYVPTRHEVATMEPEELVEILDGWIWKSPTELIPRPGQIEEVRQVLLARSDLKDPGVQEILALVDDYLDGGPGSKNEPTGSLT